jgi:uncharacterized membrane protein YphA (DoxX/SURF4 family)
MELLYQACKLLLIVSFVSYGLVCAFTGAMVEEFERYGMPALRQLTGILEVLGALGLAAGYLYPRLTTISAACLALLMVAAVLVRIRVGDPPLAMLPALFLLGVCVFVFAYPRSTVALAS